MTLAYRVKQTERRNETLKMFAGFLEINGGSLIVSIHESHYSSGTQRQPDIVYKEFGIEVKRVEFLSRARFNKGDNFRLNIGTMSLNRDSWKWLNE